MDDSMATRARLLAAASDLVYRQGYAATGVAQICAEAGARKGSFYHFWPSKSALVAATLESSWVEHQEKVLDPAFSAATLVEQLQSWGDRLAEVHRAHQQAPGGSVHGCRFGNLALEVSTSDSTLRQAVAGYLEAMAQVVAGHLRAASVRGEWRDDFGVDGGAGPADAAGRDDDMARRAADAGRALVAHMEGLAVLAKVTDDPTPLRRLGPDAARLLGLSAEHRR